MAWHDDAVAAPHYSCLTLALAEKKDGESHFRMPCTVRYGKVRYGTMIQHSTARCDRVPTHT
jgi:hypothetical protein